MTGAFLGVFCIIGVGTRTGYSGNEVYLLGMWYNRVVMGLIVGLSRSVVLVEDETPDRILGEILALARQYGLSSYDASYLDLAIRTSLPMATLDKDLRRAARRCGVTLWKT